MAFTHARNRGGKGVRPPLDGRRGGAVQPNGAVFVWPTGQANTGGVKGWRSEPGSSFGLADGGNGRGA
jgi:hypothetical protein